MSNTMNSIGSFFTLLNEYKKHCLDLYHGHGNASEDKVIIDIVDESLIDEDVQIKVNDWNCDDTTCSDEVAAHERGLGSWLCDSHGNLIHVME